MYCSFSPHWSLYDFTRSFAQFDICVLLSPNPEFPRHKQRRVLLHKDAAERETTKGIKPALWKSGPAGRYYRR